MVHALVASLALGGVSVSVSVALLLAWFGSVTPDGSVTVAVFASSPVADDAMVALTV